MKKLLVIVSIIVSLFIITTSSALAWAPVTHYKIGQEVNRLEPQADVRAFLTGTVLPDMALSNPMEARFDRANALKRQQMFHAPEFYDALEGFAFTPELKSFVNGYHTHLGTDPIEEAYSRIGLSRGAPYPADMPYKGVDAILWSRPNGSITITSTIATLIIAAWNYTYPDSKWKPTYQWLASVQRWMNFYLNGYVARTAKAQAERWYYDWRIPIDQSVQTSLQIIN